MRFRPRPLREALRPEFSTPMHGVVWVQRACLLALAAYSLAVEPQFTTRPLLVTSALWGLFASLAFAFVPTRRPSTLKAAEALTLAASTAHVVGHAFGIYAAFPVYDTILHLLVPLATVLALYALSQATDWIWTWREVSALTIGIYLFSMSVALAALWEILEFGMDQLFGTKEQDNLADTMYDLIADVVGAAIGAAIVGAWTARRRRIAGAGGERLKTDERPAARRARARAP